MKLKIDEAKCDLCGTCIELCPEVFQRTDDKIVVIEVLAPHEWMKCYACIGNCPQNAIIVANKENLTH